MLSSLRRFKHVFAVLAIGSVVSLAAVDMAEARRASSSGSLGSRGERTFSAPATTNTAPGTAAPIQRTMTPNQQQTAPGVNAPQTAQPQQPRRGLFSGFGGGLMGGLLMGGLVGMMLGHGFGGFGGLLQILLIGGLIFLAMRMFARRSQPAADTGRYAYEPPPAQGPGFRIPQMGGGPAAAPAAPRQASAATDEIGITNRDLDAFEGMLTRVQTAYGAEDYASLRAITTPEAMSYLAEELGDNATHGLKNEVRDVKLLQGDLSESWRENGHEYATVAMRYQSIDVMRERATGRLVQGDPDRPTEAVEVWTFVREPGQEWKLSAIQAAH
ncbi:Tim44 domain-containing protein [Rhizobium oryzicola]|uniref:Tim44 domain-containing protein n=1 Tax=Rhizobium oryzicola TaxID=1232668 RepID=A0ABT8SUG0_9HYPH|nr:Tim44 domain-containing protein [Rhizobium oryzicola]MDO1582070.1 Tim44 domain-containing protein [Rhizobium oryzicola]